MSVSGCGVLIKFVNSHVMLGISWVYLCGAVVLQCIATLHMKPSRLSDVLFSEANLCFFVMGLEGFLYTLAMVVIFIQFYGITKKRMEPGTAWGDFFFSSSFRQFLYLVMAMQICSPIFFIGLAAATWRASLLMMFTNTFNYETAAKPTGQKCTKD